MSRISKIKTVLWIILGVAAAVGITRFIYGLGATTNMTDNTPWGFWIGFDVMGGVALAAGGFVIAALNYIFKIKAFHPIARAAILTAFLGYIAVAVGLLFDLGLPWNIWHMIIFWNPHSPLFEVGWCVMLYLSVLFLEFAPVILEKFPNIPLLQSIYNFLNKIKIGIVILGIMLSTLHQSSLGSLFLAMPYKLHPLWYSPIIPIIFFVSAICLGLMMVMSESMASSYLYKKEPEREVVSKISKFAIFMLIFYTVLRFADILFRGAGVFLFDGSTASFLFWGEIMLSVAIPLIIFSLPAAKEKVSLLFTGSAIGVLGVVFNRLNVGGLTHLNNLTGAGDFYFPAWTELFISAGVVSGAALVFFFFIENFKVWEEPPVDPEELPGVKPKFNTNRVYYGAPKVANRTVFSFAFVVAFGFGFAFMSGNKIDSEGFETVEATNARGDVNAVLFIDGNKDGYGVNFKHGSHANDMDSLKAWVQNCASCHHMNNPDDENSTCEQCHSMMYTPGDAFRHDWHASSDGGNLKCFDCHEEGMYKSSANAKGCESCHDNMIAEGSTIKVEQYKTLSYVDAMHKLCIDCHEQELANRPDLKASKPGLATCQNCHPDAQPHKYVKKLFEKKQANRWVVIPSRMK